MDVDAALKTQIRNIEANYGHPLSHWFEVIDASGLTKHNEVVAMLKADHGLTHGSANRVSLLSRDRRPVETAGDSMQIDPVPADPVTALYSGAKAKVRPLHDAVLAVVSRLGDFDVAPKKGYLSLRRRKQFAMLQPSSTGRLDLGLILPAGTPHTPRAESAAGFNAMFSHRVRLTGLDDLDAEVERLIADAFGHAG
jgi:Domain of unknown function (DUF4287)/Domain of unknown function (DUF5655)